MNRRQPSCLPSRLDDLITPMHSNVHGQVAVTHPCLGRMNIMNALKSIPILLAMSLAQSIALAENTNTPSIALTLSNVRIADKDFIEVIVQNVSTNSFTLNVPAPPLQWLGHWGCWWFEWEVDGQSAQVLPARGTSFPAAAPGWPQFRVLFPGEAVRWCRIPVEDLTMPTSVLDPKLLLRDGEIHSVVVRPSTRWWGDIIVAPARLASPPPSPAKAL